MLGGEEGYVVDCQLLFLFLIASLVLADSQNINFRLQFYKI